MNAWKYHQKHVTIQVELRLAGIDATGQDN
jgi:hypothetical protein